MNAAKNGGREVPVPIFDADTTTIMQTTHSTTGSIARRPARRAFTLVEIMVVVTIIGIVAAVAAPSYRRAIEQSRAEIAAANLRAIWAAERVYWLENQTYTDDLSQLQGLFLLDPALKTAEPPLVVNSGQYWDLYYWYSVTLVGPDPANPPYTTFTVTCKPSLYTGCTGSFTIDEKGAFGGGVTPPGWTVPITPIDLW